jgi:hypothetical protein
MKGSALGVFALHSCSNAIPHLDCLPDMGINETSTADLGGTKSKMAVGRFGLSFQFENVAT